MPAAVRAPRMKSRFLQPSLYGLLVVPSFVLATRWWNLWMYKGWSAPPKFSNRLLEWDGEGAYDAVLLDMFGASWALLSILLYAGLKLRARRITSR